MPTLEHKNILVTGVSRGLGLEICKALLQKGAIVIGIARTINANIEVLVNTYSDQFKILMLDLGDIHTINEKVRSFLSEHELKIDGLVNNAAMGSDTLISDLTEEHLVQLTHVNQLAPILLSKAIIRNMILHNTAGSLVHITSVAAHTGYSGLAAYAATKGAMEAFSKACAREWGRKGIRSNCVSAGFMETDMTGEMNEENKAKVYGRNALKKPTEISSVVAGVLFLLSEESSSMTGKTMGIDAGAI